jgi:hypothetical protein
MSRTTEVRAQVGAHFVCEHCKYEMGALVQGQGIVSGSSFQNPNVDARRAFEAAMQHAKDTLLYVPCPNCKRTNTTYGPAVKRRLLLQMFGIPSAIIGAATAYVMYDAWKHRPFEALPYLGGFWLFVIGLVYLTVPKPWVGAEARTQFAKPK